VSKAIALIQKKPWIIKFWISIFSTKNHSKWREKINTKMGMENKASFMKRDVMSRENYLFSLQP